MTMTQTIDETLAERGQRYGEFADHAMVTQNIKQAMQDSLNWDNLDYDMIECLEMVAHKIGRILNGDPTYVDSWTDIIGYVRLVEKRLIAEEGALKADVPCTDPKCPDHNPAIRQAIETLRAAGVIVYP
jgi:uncharacterized protein (UPF0297 family)